MQFNICVTGKFCMPSINSNNHYNNNNQCCLNVLVENITRRWKTFKRCSEMLLDGYREKTRPYPTPPCALAKILPEKTVRA